MRRSFAWMVVCSVVSLVACGDDSTLPPPPLVMRDTGVEDSGAAGTDGGIDAAMTDAGDVDAGDSGVMLTGDLCMAHLAGASCQVKKLAAGRHFTCALFNDGGVKCWGRWGGIIGDSAMEMGDSLPFVDFGEPIADIAAGEYQLSALAQSGRVYTALYSGTGEVRVQSLTFDPGDTIDSLGGPSCVVLDSGGIKCWAWEGSAGSGGAIVYTLRQPALVVLEGDLQVVSAAQASTQSVALWSSGQVNVFNTCALTATGEATCWGATNQGQLGTGRHEPGAAIPIVDIRRPIAAIAPGREHTCAVTSDDSRLRCWGKNTLGQLGQGGSTSIGQGANDIANATPVDLPGEVESMALGGDHTCVVTVRGAVFCFGANANGQSGAGDASNVGVAARDYPLRALDLGTGRGALQVVAGESHSCALLDDHSVKCWGLGQLGAIGSGSTANRGDDDDEMGDALERVNLGLLTLAGLQARSPQVTVRSPLPSENPVLDVIHTGNTLAVECIATASEESGIPVNESTVTVRVHRGDVRGEVVGEAIASGSGGGEFHAVVNGLGDLSTGLYWVECIATDIREMSPYVGRAAVPFLHDGGPSIDVTSHANNDVVGQVPVLHLEVSVLPALLAANDMQAGVTGTRFVIAGVEFPLVPVAGQAGRYTVDIDFFSHQFEPPPSGLVSILIEATNQRSQTSRLQRNIQVDGTGPTIVVQGMNHDNGDIVRGAQVMLLTITDMPAGVAPTGVYGRIGTTMFPFVNTTGTTFRGVFDTLAFDRTVSQLTVEIHAFDRVGNETIEPRTLHLDNQPPIVSLDSPPVREIKLVSQAYQCSTPFDPLGDDTVNDRELVPEGAEFRARVEDMTNGVAGNEIVSILAGVNANEVDLLVLTDLTRPILIDTNNDGACDEINDELTALGNTSQFQTLSLRALPPKGNSLYTTVELSDPTAPPMWAMGPPPALVCTAPMMAPAMPPQLVCMPQSSSSELTRIIKANVSGSHPAIWGLPGGTDALACAGHYWDWQLPIPNGGPACVVARAVDNVGNVGVSRPLRVCLQRSGPLGSTRFDCLAGDQAWRDHDCLSGAYDARNVTCTAPRDFVPEYRRAD